jgi:hypothetical protein
MPMRISKKQIADLKAMMASRGRTIPELIEEYFTDSEEKDYLLEKGVDLEDLYYGEAQYLIDAYKERLSFSTFEPVSAAQIIRLRGVLNELGAEIRDLIRAIFTSPNAPILKKVKTVHDLNQGEAFMLLTHPISRRAEERIKKKRSGVLTKAARAKDDDFIDIFN